MSMGTTLHAETKEAAKALALDIGLGDVEPYVILLALAADIINQNILSVWQHACISQSRNAQFP